MTYLLTFACYGSWLHGDPRGSVERQPRFPQFQRNARLEANPVLERYERNIQKEPTLVLDEASRESVLAAIREVARHRGWRIVAAHVRSEHVHVVVETDCPPERALVAFKAYATRRLMEERIAGERKKYWSRGGSRTLLRTSDAVNHAVRYVIEKQGQPMAWHLDIGWQTRTPVRQIDPEGDEPID